MQKKRKRPQRVTGEGQPFNEEVIANNQPEKFQSTGDAKKPKTNKQVSWIIGIGSLVGLVIILISLSAYLYWYIRSFEKNAGVSVNTLAQSFQTGLRKEIFGPDNQMTILLLGIDAVPKQRDNSLLTDTMMLIAIRRDGKIIVISIPRDLWIAALKTKVNALYYYGEKEALGNGPIYTQAILTDITGVNIDRVLVVNLNLVKNMVDLMGGVPILVSEAFTDSQFPRDEADITSTNPAELYKTVTFQPGMELMSGQRVLEYIRSRKSTDLNEGTDIARGLRQKGVILALIKKAISPQILIKPTEYGRLYQVWHQDINESIPDWMWVALGKALYDKKISLINLGLSEKNAANPEGLLMIPDMQKYQQWVYEPVDPSFTAIKQYLNIAIDTGK